MLDNFLFSLEIVLPLFALLALGYALRAFRVLPESFANEANRLLFYVVLPIKLASDLWKIGGSNSLGLTLNAVVILGTLGVTLLSYLVTLPMKLDVPTRGTFIQGAFRGNYVYIGYVLLERMTGQVDPRAPLVLIATMILYNGLPIFFLTQPDATKSRGKQLLGVLKKIVTNPLIIGVFVGLVLGGIHVPRFHLVDTTLGYLAQLTTPLALLSIGASFRFSEVKACTGLSLLSTLIKLVVGPALVLLVASQLSLTKEDLLLLYVVFGVPTAVSSYPMVCEMGGNRTLGAGVILYSTALSVFSMAGFIFVFKLLGWL